MNPEDNKNTADLTKPQNALGNSISSVIFYLAILIFIIGFNFSDRMAGNWYQQFLPNINGASIRDITFTDSLNGFAVTSIGGSNSYILKTTNSGDNWAVKFTHNQPFVRVQFINANTGFTNAFQTIFKTTNAGENWTPINLPGIFGDDMFVLNQDTIWLAMSESLTGGVFRTTNGGANWEQQLNIGSSNPDRIFMINGNVGFISQTNNYTRITTNSGVNWTILFSGSGQGFYDMYFSDSLTGWGTFSNTRKTINGGLNWAVQTMPSGGNITSSTIEKLTGLNKDTIYGAGAFLLTTLGFRGMINRTTNGGENWHFQVPDSVTIQIGQYNNIDFVNKLNGWAYRTSPTGIHTTTGGDPVWLTPVHQISSEVPKEFSLSQNYPNPFNPVTKIRYAVKRETSNVKLIVYDIQGKIITELINQKQTAGIYEVVFNGSSYSSGVYFYTLIIEGKVIDTKKMALVK